MGENPSLGSTRLTLSVEKCPLMVVRKAVCITL